MNFVMLKLYSFIVKRKYRSKTKVTDERDISKTKSPISSSPPIMYWLHFWSISIMCGRQTKRKKLRLNIRKQFGQFKIHVQSFGIVWKMKTHYFT